MKLTVFLLPGEEALLFGGRNGGYVWSSHDRVGCYDKRGEFFFSFFLSFSPRRRVEKVRDKSSIKLDTTEMDASGLLYLVLEQFEESFQGI